MPPVFSPSAPFRRPPESIARLHKDTRSCLNGPVHGGSGRLEFCRLPRVAGGKQGSDASHQDSYPEVSE